MYLVELSFTSETGPEDDKVSHAVNGLHHALRMNGQILGREYPIIVSSNRYTTFMLVPEPDALNSAHFNHYVRDDFEELKSIGLSTPNIVVLGKDIDGAEICTCTEASTYILKTNYISLESPLRCGKCYLPVPFYRIPATYDAEYSDIIAWQSDYQSCDSLQMNCSTLERASTRELSRVDSSLSLHGREICNKIFQLTQRPTYYYLYRYGGRSRAQELKRRCPSCNGDWLSEPPWHLFDFKCDTCHLVSNIAWDVR